jgi:hypothetical protein
LDLIQFDGNDWTNHTSSSFVADVKHPRII